MNTANENILVEGTEVSIERISFKAGFIVSACLIIYFMVMQAFHLVGSGTAWGFNFVILSIGLALTYRTYRSHTSPNIDYFPGVILGAMTTAISTVVYVLFVYFYLSAIDQESLVLLKDNVLFLGKEITPLKVAVATLIEGICSGVIISFVLMQYYKSGFGKKSFKSVPDRIVQDS